MSDWPFRDCGCVRLRPAGVQARGCEQGEDLADGGSPGAGLGHRQAGLDPVAVAAAVLLPDHVAGLGEIGDDAVGAALGDAQAGRDVTQPRARVVREAQQHPGVLVRKPQLAI